MPTKSGKTFRVGLLVASSLIVLMVFLFFIGAEQKIFARKHEYDVQLENVSGLAEGNPVRMAGVTIGTIKEIRLPRDPKQRNVQIQLMIDRKYSERVRGDSRARLKKLGLLTGDSYIDVTPGTLRYPELEPGSMIPAMKQTNVDQLISSGEDLVDNLVQISYSLKNILGRVDRGEGLIGELTSSPETKQRITDTLLTTLNKTNAALKHMESGRGVLGKLIYDDAYGDQLTASLNSAVGSVHTLVSGIQRSFETGNGMLPALLNDPQGRERINALVENLRTTSANLATFSTSLQTGEGLLPRLLNDKPYGDQALSEFTLLISQLNETVRKLNTGEGTAGKLIADPSVYESVNDILIGINESKLLRWLIRNRQQSGIERRYQQRRDQSAPAPDVQTQVAPPENVTPAIAPSTTTAEPAVSAPAATTGEVPAPVTTTTAVGSEQAAPVATTTAAPPETTVAAGPKP